MSARRRAVSLEADRRAAFASGPPGHHRLRLTDAQARALHAIRARRGLGTLSDVVLALVGEHGEYSEELGRVMSAPAATEGTR